jgi:hypothetical protein
VQQQTPRFWKQPSSIVWFASLLLSSWVLLRSTVLVACMACCGCLCLPQVKMQPARINSTQPSLARRFVDQQVQLIQQHTKQREAQLQLQQQSQQPMQQVQQLTRHERQQIAEAAFIETEQKIKRELDTAG